jgi:serine/threonine-protein kinase RsbW
MKFSLVLPREPLSIPVIRRVLGDALHGLGVSHGCAADILVAVSEACTNAVRHADTVTRYEVIAGIDEDFCVIKVVDAGRGFDVSVQAAPPSDSESGRGIKLMRSLVDDVSFESGPGVGTVVYLQKRLTWSNEGPMRALERELVPGAR